MACAAARAIRRRGVETARPGGLLLRWRFRWRWSAQRSRRLLAYGHTPFASPVEGLAKYEGSGEQNDNYRHRMIVNLAALAFTVALAVAGIWLAIQIADMRKNQDCLLSGRRNCAPIDVKALER